MPKGAANMVRRVVAGVLMLAVAFALGAPALAHQVGVPAHAPVDHLATDTIHNVADHRDVSQVAYLTSQQSHQDPCADGDGKAGKACCAASHCFMSCSGLPGALTYVLPQPRGPDHQFIRIDRFTVIFTLPALPPPRSSA